MKADILEALEAGRAAKEAEDPANAATSWKPPPVVGRKPRVVCLHGTACGEQIFRTQLSKLLSQNKDVEFIFVEGQVKIEEGPAFETMQKFFPGCPTRAYDELQFDEKGWRAYKDPKATLEYLQSQLKAHAPVDGLLGFSQGSNFCAMLAAQAAAGVGVPIGFAVLLCPNAPGYVDQLPDLFAAPLPVPTLLVRGDKEDYGAGLEALYAHLVKEGTITLDTRGEDVPANHLVKLLADVEVMVHPEAHRPLPSNKASSESVISRIFSFIAEKSA